MPQPTRLASLALAAVFAVGAQGCFLVLNVGGGNDPSGPATGVGTDGGLGTAHPADGGDGGPGNAPEPNEAKWANLDVPALAAGVRGAFAIGREVWVVTPESVVRIDASRAAVLDTPEGARGMAGATVVRAAGQGDILALGPTGGVRYSRSLDQATPVTRDGAPEMHFDPVAAWTGTSLLVWGGGSAIGRPSLGASYYPSSDRWVALSTASAPVGRVASASVWSGNQLFVFGGRGAGDVLLGDGARYSPSTGLWRSLPTTDAPSARDGHSAVWTGSEMVVWGGRDASGVVRSGSAFDPARDAWRSVGEQQAPAARTRHIAVWAGSRMVVWGGFDGQSERRDGGIFDVHANQWIPLVAPESVRPRAGAVAVWTGNELVVVGGTTSEVASTQVTVWRPAQGL